MAPSSASQQVPSRRAAERASAPTLLFVTNVAWFFISHRLPIARAAKAAGLDVHLASDFEDPGELAELEREGIVFHRLHMARSGLNPLEEVRSIWELGQVIQRLRPTVLHNVTSKPVVYGSCLARVLRVPLVVNAISGFGHVYGAQPGRRLLRVLLDRAYALALGSPNVRVIVQNEADRAEVLRVCPGAHARVRLIRGSGVDLEVFRAQPEPPGIPTVLLPARLLRDKGIYEFAMAAAELKRAGVAARFVLAGRLDAANRSALTANEVRDLCASSGVEWMGEVRDMPHLYQASHLVCLPSYYREGVPKVLLEACACGRPIITTDTPGCRDVIDRGLNGLLVPARDAGALAAAISALVCAPERRRHMGAAARALAEREFGIERVIAQHLDIYRQLLPGRLTAGTGA
jgi:glycosyltransferase involved in cell wall biosynthesis